MRVTFNIGHLLTKLLVACSAQQWKVASGVINLSLTPPRGCGLLAVCALIIAVYRWAYSAFSHTPPLILGRLNISKGRLYPTTPRGVAVTRMTLLQAASS